MQDVKVFLYFRIFKWQKMENAKKLLGTRPDEPCSYHTKHPSRPAQHTNRDCSRNRRPRENTGPATRPAPVTGANAIPVNTPARPVDNRVRPQDVNQVADMANTNNNPNAGPSRQNQYREPHQSYMVFVTEPNDKLSQYRRAMEVNAVMPAVPKFMYWSEIGRASCRERVFRAV